MPLEIPVDDGIALLAFFSATSKAFFFIFFFWQPLLKPLVEKTVLLYMYISSAQHLLKADFTVS